MSGAQSNEIGLQGALDRATGKGRRHKSRISHGRSTPKFVTSESAMTEHPDTSSNDLSKLEDTYEILSTLQEDRASATYLARHKELGRDVTITVVHMPDGGANNTLTHFASDARLLSSARHENIVPVIEGRWLNDATFAVVRVLARGTTLAETLTESGAFSQERAAETLEQVSQGLQWARESGIVHRTVDSETVGFQQGSGRVMMSLGLSP